MLKIINKKIISFTMDYGFFEFVRFNKTFILDSLNKQSDCYFGEGNWYAERIYSKKGENNITFLMDVVVDENGWEEYEYLKEVNKK